MPRPDMALPTRVVTAVPLLASSAAHQQHKLVQHGRLSFSILLLLAVTQHKHAGQCSALEVSVTVLDWKNLLFCVYLYA